LFDLFDLFDLTYLFDQPVKMPQDAFFFVRGYFSIGGNLKRGL
jgi:hypothetical protein